MERASLENDSGVQMVPPWYLICGAFASGRTCVFVMDGHKLRLSWMCGVAKDKLQVPFGGWYSLPFVECNENLDLGSLLTLYQECGDEKDNANH